MHRAMIPVLSSNIDGYRYLNDRELLLIAFKGGKVYAYEDVPEAEIIGFMNAKSKGTYFGKMIKNVYKTAPPLDEMAVANILFGLEMTSQQKPSPRRVSTLLPQLQLKYPMLSAIF